MRPSAGPGALSTTTCRQRAGGSCHPVPSSPASSALPGEGGTQPPVSGDSGRVFLLRLQAHRRHPAHYPLLEARQPWGSALGLVKHQDHSSEAKSHQGLWAGIRTSSQGEGDRDEGRRGHSHAPEAEDSQGFQLGNFKNILRQDSLEKPGHHLFLTASGL